MLSSSHSVESPAQYSLRNVTAEMVVVRSDKNVSFEERWEIVTNSAEDPYSLVGWQVSSGSGSGSGRKNIDSSSGSGPSSRSKIKYWLQL